MWTLQERPLEAKLELLYKGHLYPLALSVIRSFATSYLEDERIDENTRKQRTQEIERMTMSTHKMYADHLYSKTQYQEAIKQYIFTIGHLEPSYVIRKFLDTQRTSQLSKYVEELHHRQRAGTYFFFSLSLSLSTLLKRVEISLIRSITHRTPSQLLHKNERSRRIESIHTYGRTMGM